MKNFLSIHQKSPNYVLKKIGNSGVLVDIFTNRFIYLNETGILVWQLLDRFRVEKIVEIFVKTTKQKKSIVSRDIGNLIGDLYKIGALIHPNTDQQRWDSKDFFNTIVIPYRKKRNLLSVVCELTHKCNFRCQHCYIPSMNSTKNLELDKKNWIEIINKLNKAGVFSILFTGGEPFIRSDFKDIYLHAKTKGFHISLYTNGYYLPESIIPFLIKYPPTIIAITIYGASNKTYKKFTSINNAWDKVSYNIKFLKSLGFNLKLRTQLNLINYEELNKIRAFAAGHKIPFNYRTTICPYPERKNNFQCQSNISLGPDEIAYIEKNDKVKSKQRTTIDPQIPLLLKTNPYQNIIWHCGAGITSCLITPYGIMTPCVQLRYPSYDLKKISITEAWKNMYSDIKAEINKAEISNQAKTCIQCKIISQCEICPAWIMRIKEKKVREFISTLCKLAKERSKIFPSMGINKIIRR